MKILVTSIVDPMATAHNRLHHFISALSPGNEIHVVSIKDTWKTATCDTTAYAEGNERFLGAVKVKYLNVSRSPTWQEVSSIWRMRKTIESLEVESFDIHLDYNSIFMGNSVKLSSRIPRTVYDLADDLTEMVRTSPQINSTISPLVARISSTLVRKRIGASDMVTCISRTLLDRYKVPQDKAAIIPNGVDAIMFAPSDGTESRTALGIEKGVFVVGYVGVLREWTDMNMALRAIEHLGMKGENVKLLVVGEEGGLDHLLLSAERMGISERVLSVGTVPFHRVPEMISAMDVGIIPFKPGSITHSAVPLKLFEYMACGKPVITTYSDSIYEHVGDGALYSDSWKDMSDCISTLINDYNEYSRYSMDGRRLVEDKFSWDGIEANMKRVVETG